VLRLLTAGADGEVGILSTIGGRRFMENSGDIFSLLYLSEGSIPFSKKDLRELLTKARENNTSLGITGMLVFKDGNFLQVLEGKKETVLALYEKIAQDTRHIRLMTLFQGVSSQRDFPDWSMGFHDLNSPESMNVPGFSHFLNTSLTSAEFVDARRAKRLLLLFKEEKLLGSPHCLVQGRK
jgi:Sensors of blue-light using FAD